MKSMHGALAFPQRTNSQLPNIRPVYMVSSLSIRIFDLEEMEGRADTRVTWFPEFEKCITKTKITLLTSP